MSNDATTEQNVTVEWGVHWPDDEFEVSDDEDDARRTVRQFPSAVLVSRTVTRSPWTATS